MSMTEPSNPPSAVSAAQLILEPLQIARLETMLWKKRALALRHERAEDSLRETQEDSRQANLEFLRLARSFGIDVKRSFEWGEDGKVSYLQSDSPATPATSNGK
jgi:hypothetical protein